MMDDTFDESHKALDRMKRAYHRGTGCHLTAEMIKDLSVTIIGQIWEEEREENESRKDNLHQTL